MPALNIGPQQFSLVVSVYAFSAGASGLLAEIASREGLKPGETSPDNELSMLTARCFGACGLAPVVVLDGEVVGRVTPDEMERRIHQVVETGAFQHAH